MKRIGNLYSQICNLENIVLAERKASFKGWLIHCNSTKLRKKYEQYY